MNQIHSHFRLAVESLAGHETKCFFATLITDSFGSICSKLANFETIRSKDPVVWDAIFGYHLEVPWLSPKHGYRGAHDTQFMGLPSLADFDNLQQFANGNIKLLTMAAELPGGAALIREITMHGVQVSSGSQ